MIIRDACTRDAAEIVAIYNPYIRNSHVTFETEELESSEIAQRINNVQQQALPWVVADIAGQVAGYSYATPWKARAAYSFTVESAIYVHDAYAGQGVASRLYQHVLERLRQQSVHVVLAGIAQPNPASVALHEKMGFRKVAHMPELGYKLGRWIDMGYWHLSLAPDERAH